MKQKSVLIVLLCFLTTTLVAQEINRPQTSARVGNSPIQQGNWMVGGGIGSLGYSFEGKNFNINVLPSAGYFISDGIALGVQLKGSLNALSGQENIWGYGLTPFVRYYFPQGSTATGRFFAHGNIGVEGSRPGAGASLALGANLGYSHFVTNSVALELTAGYNYSKATAINAVAQTGLGVGLGFQIYLPWSN